jgi:murein DD-endopeptidase MepM/ murein hydrolase activator NlpD
MVRGFRLAPLKETWKAPDIAGEELLFENELTPSGPEGVQLVTRIGSLPGASPASPGPGDEPQGHFFLDRYLPLSGDTLKKAADRLGCIPQVLSLLNHKRPPDAKLDATRSIEIYRGPISTYVVQQGDTLWSISRKFKVPLREILWLNRLDHLSIKVGRQLYIARGIVSRNVEQRASTDLQTSELLAKARQQMRHGKEASAAYTRGVRVSRPIPGTITSGFGWRRHPILKRPNFHKAVDIVAKEGTPIRALYGGTVIFSGDSGAGGKSVILRHPKNLYTVYAHCAVLFVSKGDEITQGTVVGQVGHTGQATAAHLHFAMRRGASPLDPLPFLR